MQQSTGEKPTCGYREHKVYAKQEWKKKARNIWDLGSSLNLATLQAAKDIFQASTNYGQQAKFAHFVNKVLSEQNSYPFITLYLWSLCATVAQLSSSGRDLTACKMQNIYQHFSEKSFLTHGTYYLIFQKMCIVTIYIRIQIHK